MSDYDTRLYLRNLRTMASAQANWDNMAEPEPDDPDGDEPGDDDDIEEPA